MGVNLFQYKTALSALPSLLKNVYKMFCFRPRRQVRPCACQKAGNSGFKAMEWGGQKVTNEGLGAVNEGVKAVSERFGIRKRGGWMPQVRRLEVACGWVKSRK